MRTLSARLFATILFGSVMVAPGRASVGRAPRLSATPEASESRLASTLSEKSAQEAPASWIALSVGTVGLLRRRRR